MNQNEVQAKVQSMIPIALVMGLMSAMSETIHAVADSPITLDPGMTDEQLRAMDSMKPSIGGDLLDTIESLHAAAKAVDDQIRDKMDPRYLPLSLAAVLVDAAMTAVRASRLDGRDLAWNMAMAMVRMAAVLRLARDTIEGPSREPSPIEQLVSALGGNVQVVRLGPDGQAMPV